MIRPGSRSRAIKIWAISHASDGCCSKRRAARFVELPGTPNSHLLELDSAKAEAAEAAGVPESRWGLDEPHTAEAK